MKIVDLRSDTVTRPTPEMREAMYRAEVGDDVYGEDPTVNHLEELGAQRLGFAAGLFLTSGTMGNLVALLTHTQKGDEVILEGESHIYYYEAGGMAALGGVMPRLIKGERGKITPAMVREVHRGDNIHFPRPTLLCLENTHNRGGGSMTGPAEMAATIACAQELNLKVHIDGARIFNAAAASRCDVKELVRGADSVQFCLSKGLGTPMGSLLVGSREYIDRARKWRKMIGGGCRQIGIMAAAGLVALESMTDRLAEDHALAKKLALGLAEIPYLTVNPDEVETNIVVIHLNEQIITVPQFLLRLKEHGIKANGYGGNRVRFVTHLDVREADIDYTLQVISELKKEL
ncbi:MAG: low-specificity L-threonine aldolase [Clostridia bacterium]|jgi:threonine aldolase|nr:low-specificity L-threonine aldolase [Clostridia bacterium]